MKFIFFFIENRCLESLRFNKKLNQLLLVKAHRFEA
jgi:hypothetical protein